jgi:hypothetical protein
MKGRQAKKYAGKCRDRRPLEDVSCVLFCFLPWEFLQCLFAPKGPGKRIFLSEVVLLYLVSIFRRLF